MAKCTPCEEQKEKIRNEIISFMQSNKKKDKPFEDLIVNEKFKLRKFSKDIDPLELKWHQDEEDRIVKAVNENDWQFQFDNELPIQMIPDKAITIKKGVWHRILRGNSDLIISIETL